MRESRYFLSSQVTEDVKSFIQLFLSILIHFYSPIIAEDKLCLMKEDLIELTASTLLRDDTYKIVMAFFKLETSVSNTKLIEKYKHFISVKPENIGID